MLHRRALLGGLLTVPAAVSSARGQSTDPTLRALADGGVAALIRHARAPGTGDPPGFRLGDCATQRNLDDGGRKEAAALGERLRAAGVLVVEARSSRWCRALDTARLAFPDVPTRPEAALDSFFDHRSGAAEQTEAARRLVTGWRGRQGVLALVTHQVNITALTKVYPAEGEIVVLRPEVGGFSLVGRLAVGS